MFYQIFICFCIFSSLICNAFGSILNTVPSTENIKTPLFPYTNRIGGRMIEKPRRRLKPKSPLKPEKPEIHRIQKRSADLQQSETYLEPFADAILEVALSQEQLPLDRYPKRSRNRVSEGF